MKESKYFELRALFLSELPPFSRMYSFHAFSSSSISELFAKTLVSDLAYTQWGISIQIGGKKSKDCWIEGIFWQHVGDVWNLPNQFSST